MRRFPLLAVFLLLAACSSRPADRADWGAGFKEHVVAADHPLASAAGAEILAAGGNVVDAAAATSFALAVLRPYSAGLGGGGFMILYRRGEEPVVLDYRETAPTGSVPAAYLDSAGKVIRGKTVHGLWAVGVPGQLRGIVHALETYGTMDLKTVMAPAIRLAKEGFPVDSHTHEAMAFLAKKLRALGPAGRREPYAEVRRLFLREGRPYRIGQILRQRDLAKTLEAIAEKGPDYFYESGFAEKLLSLEGRNGGPMTPGDLAGYKVRVRKPLESRFRGYTVLGMPPPSSGGACLMQILNVLDDVRPDRIEPEAYTHLLVEGMRHSFADRAAFLGDADFHPEVDGDVSTMISRAHARMVRAAVAPGRTFPAQYYGLRGLKDDSGTTHYSIIDRHGNAVAATETINTYFGSLVVVPGTGVVLNNELDDFTIRTGVPNEFGLLMSERNLISPGKRPLSSMSPTILVERGRAVLAAGGSGGPRIITGTLQTILNVVDFGMSPEKAVAAKRLHHQWSPDRLLVEKGYNADLRRSLEDAGHRFGEYRHEAAVQMVYRKSSGLYGASDPRKGGAPAGR